MKCSMRAESGAGMLSSFSMSKINHIFVKINYHFMKKILAKSNGTTLIEHSKNVSNIAVKISKYEKSKKNKFPCSLNDFCNFLYDYERK